MTPTRPREEQLLEGAERAIDESLRVHGSGPDARLDILEAAASAIGGWALDHYTAETSGERELSPVESVRAARRVLSELERVPIEPTLALCSLARIRIANLDRRRSGSYYTDFRLAKYLAEVVAKSLTPDSTIVDPASGTGILIAAVVLATCGGDKDARARMIANGVAAADFSDQALRGVQLCLASLVDRVDPIIALGKRLKHHDSLLAGPEGWADFAPFGFDAVVANPPWEKLKVTRHEFLVASGTGRHYGDDYTDGGDTTHALTTERARVAGYVKALNERYPLSGHGEADLFRAFIELSFGLAKPDDGHAALIVPAGLIRSKGTEELRRHIFLDRSMELTVFENRARFFAVDSRLKFLVLHVRAGTGADPVTIRHANGTPDGVVVTGNVEVGRGALRDVRPDFTVPEVRSEEEWELFERMSRRGCAISSDESLWQDMKIVRELDMSRDRTLFSRERPDGGLPLIEGRMIQQFRCGAKSYAAGTGRRATWKRNALGYAEIRPQFWVEPTTLPAAVAERSAIPRIGFCDVTGQTNERSMLAARLPSDVVCGNKVPTVTFAGESGAASDRSDLFLAAANSFALDWLLRRLVTTTVNYFVLRGLPFPQLRFEDAGPNRMIEIVRHLTETGRLMNPTAADALRFGLLRAELDALVFSAYGLGLVEAELVLRDFPSLDRGQPAIEGEPRSTVTRDAVLTRVSEDSEEGILYKTRLDSGLAAGAVPYVPSEFAVVQRAQNGGK